MRRSSEALSLLTTIHKKLDLTKQLLAAEIHLQLCRLFMEKDQYIKSENHLNSGRAIASRHYYSSHSIIEEFQRLAIVLRNRKNMRNNQIISPIKTILVE